MPTHASFFSGVGGMDRGLERAGWRTVSFSEVDAYASAVLAERWPGVPNLGDITRLAEPVGQQGRAGHVAGHGGDDAGHDASSAWHGAVLWSGGFPCQDLSVAGKRRGMGTDGDRTRSGLAYAFLDLVERHRPPAVLLENVPGLLSSNGGRDLGALLGSLGQLGYGWAFRVLDAQHFGVPQRRRRVFIVALHARIDPSGERAAEVLSVGARCGRHPATGHEAGEGAAAGAGERPDIVGQAISAKWSKQAGGPAGDEHHNLTVVPGLRDQDAPAGSEWTGGYRGLNERSEHMGHARRSGGVVGPPTDADGVRAADGLAGRLDDRAVSVSQNQRGELRTSDIAAQLTSGGGKPGQGYPAVMGVTAAGDDVMLPLGLDSHRYRCAGNGVVSSVAEWIGQRLMAVFA